MRTGAKYTPFPKIDKVSYPSLGATGKNEGGFGFCPPGRAHRWAAVQRGVRQQAALLGDAYRSARTFNINGRSSNMFQPIPGSSNAVWERRQCRRWLSALVSARWFYSMECCTGNAGNITRTNPIRVNKRLNASRPVPCGWPEQQARGLEARLAFCSESAVSLRLDLRVHNEIIFAA